MLGPLDLGTYADTRRLERARSLVSPLFLYCDPNPWHTIEQMRSVGIVAPDAWPSGVSEVMVEGSRRYRGRQRVGGECVETGTFRTAGRAWRSLRVSVRALERQLERERTYVRIRQRREELPKYLRATAGGAIQARPWLKVAPGWEVNVNLGLYSPSRFEGDRWAAIAFARAAWLAFVKRMAVPGADCCDVIEELKRTLHRGIPLVREHVLPPCCRKLDDGRYQSRVKQNGAVIWESERYGTVQEAWRAVKAWRMSQM
jgi:hypothetical protein